MSTRATGGGGTAESTAAHRLLGKRVVEKALALPTRNCRRSSPMCMLSPGNVVLITRSERAPALPGVYLRLVINAYGAPQSVPSTFTGWWGRTLLAFLHDAPVQGLQRAYVVRIQFCECADLFG